MNKKYYVIYDKACDVFVERTDWGDGEVDEVAFYHPDMVANFDTREDAEIARKQYSNSDELIVVKVKVSYEIEELT